MTEQEFIQQAEDPKGRLYRTAQLYLSSEACAVDAVDGAVCQDSLHYKHLRQPEYFATWMTRILINACSAELRRRKRELTVVELPETAAETFDAPPLRGAVARLPRELRAVVVLRYFQDLTLAETAQALDIPPGTVSTRQRKVLSLLKLHLTEKVWAMDCVEECKALRDVLEKLPSALKGAMARARARARRRRLWRWISAPVGSVAAVFAAFMLLMNLSTPLALACGEVPVLKGLAAAVAFFPSLKAAVENDLTQYIGQSQTDNGVTTTVEYVIMNEKQVNIFFTLGSKVYTYSDGTPDLSLEDGSGAPASAQYSSLNKLEEGGLRQITVDFTDGDVPNALRLDYRVDNYATGSGGASEHTHFDTPCPMLATPAAEFSFLLHFDPRFLQQGEAIQLNQWLELDDQRLCVKNMGIYPTHVRLNLGDDESDLAWLKGLEFYLEDEKGNRYEKIPSGITTSGSTDPPFMPSHRLENNYFGNAEHLKLYITGAEQLDKNLEYVTVDLNTLEAHPQPPQITSLEMEEYSDDRVLVCHTPSSAAVFTRSFYTPDGEGRSVGDWGFTIATEALENGDFLAPEGLIDQTIHPGDYHWNTVTLALNWSRFTVLDTPFSLPLK